MVDVTIIGSGIMGSSVAYELSKYELDVLILERENDISTGTTKANSAIVHAGYDAAEGSLMAKYNVLGNAMFEEFCKEVSVPFERCGSYVLAFSEEEKKHLEVLYKRGIVNGVPDMKFLDKEEILKREPNISDKVVSALYAGSAGIVGPWELAIKLVENSLENGVKLSLNSEVKNIIKCEGFFKIELSNGNIVETKSIVNAAGVYADEINNMVSENKFKITARKGEYYIFDKEVGNLTNSVIFQCPTEMGKGVLIAKTVHGNLIVGPTAEDTEDKEDLSNTSAALQYIRESASKSIEKINFRYSIRNFSGLRAEADTGDFILGEVKDVKGFFNMAGTKSPGLTSAPAMARDITVDIIKFIKDVKTKETHLKSKKQISFINLSNLEKQEIIKKDPRYGRVICRCENITEGEIVDVIHRKAGGLTLDGVKRRCRPGTGRCQGGFCGPTVQEIIARELNMKLEDVVLDKLGAYILVGETK